MTLNSALHSLTPHFYSRDGATGLLFSAHDEIQTALLLVLGCAVHCDRREAFIANIQRLSVDVQEAIVYHIKQVNSANWRLFLPRCVCRFVSVQSRRSPPPTPRPGEGHGGKRAISRCNGGLERAFLVVKGRIRWRRSRVRLERARKGPIKFVDSDD